VTGLHQEPLGELTVLLYPIAGFRGGRVERGGKAEGMEREGKGREEKGWNGMAVEGKGRGGEGLSSPDVKS